MKMKKIAAACVLALGAVGAAHAYDPTVTADIIIYVGGASAQDVAFETIAKQIMLNNGNFDMIFNQKTINAAGVYDPANDGNNFRAAFGDMDDSKFGGVGTYANKKLLIIKRSQGGSWYGVGPVANGNAVYFMNPQPGGTPCYKNGGTNWICNASVVGNLVPRVPDFGLSDVEPDLFKLAVNKPTGSSISFNVAPENAMANYTGGANPTPVYALGFGIQMNAAVPLNPALGVSRAEFAGIMTGAVTDYNQLAAYTGSGSTPIVLCRRNRGSGTQAAAQAYFLNQGCGANSLTALLPSTTTVPANGAPFTVVGNESGSNVTTCLNNNTASIGVISLENIPGGIAGDTGVFPVSTRKWVAVDGVQPVDGNGVTTFNSEIMKNGRYQFVVESTVNVPTVPTSADAAAISAAYIAAASLVSNINAAVPGSTTPITLRNVGQLALSTNGTAPEVMNASHGGKTCKPFSKVR